MVPAPPGNDCSWRFQSRRLSRATSRSRAVSSVFQQPRPILKHHQQRKEIMRAKLRAELATASEPQGALLEDWEAREDINDEEAGP